MGKGKCTLEAQPVQRQTKKKGKRRGRQRGSSVASHTGPPGSPSLALQLPHLEKLLVNYPGKTDLATMPHPLLPRTAFPLPHPSLQLQRLSPSQETKPTASLSTRSSSVLTEAKELRLVNLEKIERQTEASQVKLSAQILIKSLRHCRRKVNWYNFLGCTERQ